MPRILCWIILLILSSPGWSQNLISNPGFEMMTDYECSDPIAGFTNLTAWDSWGTPYLLRQGCRYDPIRWSLAQPPLKAAEGINNLGLIGNLHVNGFYGSTTIASELTTPLVPGQQYYFQLQASNRGVFHFIPDSLKICDTDPAKGLSVYFGDEFLLDSITLSQQPPLLRLQSPELLDTAVSLWQHLSTCFVAEEALTYIAVDQNRGEVTMAPPCEVRDIAQGLVYFGYHTRIDELILYPVPERIDTTIVSCRSQAFDVSLDRLANLPEGTLASFDWADGATGSRRILYEERSYEATIRLSCATIPVTIRVERADCTPAIFSPTAFSPNMDGNNDGFRPIIEEGFPVSDYQLSVYDRWGRLAWETRDPASVWSGRIGNRLAQEGVYAWVMRFDIVTDQDRQPVERSGTVMLIR